MVVNSNMTEVLLIVLNTAITLGVGGTLRTLTLIKKELQALNGRMHRLEAWSIEHGRQDDREFREIHEEIQTLLKRG